MRAGRLRHQITIEQPAGSRDSIGGVTSTWTVFATVWAAIEPLSGREFIAAKQVAAERLVRITVRYLDGVTEQMRIAWSGRMFQIRAILNKDEKNIMLEIMADEVNP